MEMKPLSGRRRAYDAVLKFLLYFSAALTCALLIFLIGYIFYRGLPHVSWELLSTKPSYLKDSIGILPNIVNTVFLVAVTLVVVLPLGVGAAIYLTEYSRNRRVVEAIEFATETLTGIPSIIYGLVGMLFFCQFLGLGKSLLAGALTLVIMTLPTIIRTTQESLKTVPQSYREGALALGAGKWHMIRTIVLPSSVDGIITRLHSVHRAYRGRVGGPSLHGRNGYDAQPVLHCGRFSSLLGCVPHRGPLRVRQGAGRVRRGLRYRRHFDGTHAGHQPRRQAGG